MQIDQSQRRLVQNEAIQRLENSHVKRTLESVLDGTDKILFVCECSDLNCRDRIGLTSKEFDEFHVKSKRFVVKPHHEIVAIEKIVAETDDYYIVEKHVDPIVLDSDYRG